MNELLLATDYSGTGIAVEIPAGYVGLLFPRSSNSKTDLLLTNHVGVIDSGYRGEISFKFATYRDRDVEANGIFMAGKASKIYDVGDGIGQLLIIPYPSIEFEEVQELSYTERGANGYGSTGK